MEVGRPERELLEWCNGARSVAGLPPFRTCPALAAAALTKCAEMAAGGPISHAGRHGNPMERQRAHGVRARTMGGENLAVYRDHGRAFLALMHSPPHRDNILHPQHDRLGLAVLPYRGGLAVCMEFAGG